MEAVAAASGVSKRTLYRQHPDKPTLLRAVVAALVDTWRPPFDAEPADAADLASSLLRLARRMLAVALTPDALALHRLAVAEAARFPEIGRALHDAGAGIGVTRIARLLAPLPGTGDADWAAEQFQRLVLSGPQHRALGFAAPLTPAEQEAWARQSVALFLDGVSRDGTRPAS